MQTINRTDPISTIVLVDDDTALRTALTFMLEQDGFVVKALPNGEALLECDLPKAPSCLVLDFNLGGMSGLEALKHLRDRKVSFPALLITSNPNASVRSAAAALDATIVEKPLLSDALLSEIVAAFDRQTDRLGEF